MPSLKETYPQWNFSGAFLAVAPSKTPPQVLTVLRKAFDEVLAEPDTIAELQKLGLAPQRLSTEQSEAVIRSTYDISKEIIEKAQIKAS